MFMLNALGLTGKVVDMIFDLFPNKAVWRVFGAPPCEKYSARNMVLAQLKDLHIQFMLESDKFLDLIYQVGQRLQRLVDKRMKEKGIQGLVIVMAENPYSGHMFSLCKLSAKYLRPPVNKWPHYAIICFCQVGGDEKKETGVLSNVPLVTLGLKFCGRCTGPDACQAMVGGRHATKGPKNLFERHKFPLLLPDALSNPSINLIKEQVLAGKINLFDGTERKLKYLD